MLLQGCNLLQSDVLHTPVVRLVALVQPWLLTTWLHRPAHSGPAGSKQGLNHLSGAKQQCSSSVRSHKSQRTTADTACKPVGKAANRVSSQQQQQPDDQCLPGTHLVSAQDDKESYQGPVGGTVVVPRKGTPLWRAAFYGNVPTSWWLDHNSRSGSPTGGCAAVSSQSSTSSTSISNWSELTAQSRYIQQAFRFQNPASPRLKWRYGQLLYGRDTTLGSSRQHSPCPRPAVNKLPWPSTGAKVWAMRLQGCRPPVPVAYSRNSYLHNRWQAACKRRRQHSQQSSARQSNRFYSRSKLRSYQLAAVKRAEKVKAFLKEFELSSDSSLYNDIVAPISGSEGLKQAQAFVAAAAAAGNVSKCAAEKDAHGRVVRPLPGGCIGAGCQRDQDGQCTSSGGSWTADASCSGKTRWSVASSTRLPGQHMGRRQRMSSDSQAAHVMQYMDNLIADVESAAQQQPGFCEQPSGNTPAAADLEDQQLSKVIRLQREMKMMKDFFRENRVSTPATESATSAAQQDHSQSQSSQDCAHVMDSGSDWEDDEDDDGDMYTDSDAESDDDWDADVYADGDMLEEIELPEEVQEVLAEPHIFRTEQNVVYGFWAKCPLG